MRQDYQTLSNNEIEDLEKSTLRAVVQALQEYSREAKDIFDNTYAPQENEVIVIAEDLTQYALEVAEFYPINKRYAGFIDYKRVRWLPTPFGLIPQSLLVDAKASTENTRDTLQRSQLPMDADFVSNGKAYQMKAGVVPHLEIPTSGGESLFAIATSLLVHFYYSRIVSNNPPFRRLRSIYILSLPHARLKHKYNPGPERTFFGQGKHSPLRSEDPRIRVYFSALRRMMPWRIQELTFGERDYAEPMWRDSDREGKSETSFRFKYIGR
jgi:hypothetical protein